MALRASKVTRKGQITIPVGIREKYEIKVGDTVLFEEQGNNITIVRQEDAVDWTAGVFRDYAQNNDGPPLTREDIWVGIAKERGNFE